MLTVGFELALFSADKLFELHLDEAYGDLFFLMAGCFHPAFFLAGVPRDFAALQSATDYPRGLKAFTQFALAPLVAVYSAILFAYAAKNSCSPQLAARLGGFAGFDSVRRGNFCRAASPPVGREHGRKMGALVRPQFPARSRYWRSWQDAGTILEALHIRTQNDSNTIALHRTRESPLSLLAIGNLGSSISWTGATLRGGRMSWATSASVWTKIF